MIEEIRKLYAKIPRSTCAAGCHDCCTNIVQFSPSEQKAFGEYHCDGECSRLSDGMCSAYENRPLVCRIYGTSELMKCEKCTPERYLTADETNEIIREYMKIWKGEERDEKKTI